jgi:hypothetical protein
MLNNSFNWFVLTNFEVSVFLPFWLITAFQDKLGYKIDDFLIGG